MKIYQLLIIQAIILSTVMAKFQRGEPHLSFMGFSEFTVYDFAEGIASGWFREDARETWGQCVEGIPNMFLQFIDIFKMLAGSDITAVFTNWSKMTELFTAIVKNMGDAPQDLMACAAVGKDIGFFVSWILKHLTIQTITTSLATNALSHVTGLIADVGSLLTSIFKFDFYTIGYDIAEILWYLFD